MRYLLLILALPVLLLSSRADELSEIDRELLLERLEALRNGEQERSGSRLATARAAFGAAAQSDAEAHALYLKCVERVRFEDEKLSGEAFREWKRRHREREDSPGLRRALRHQLIWLLLTLEVADGKAISAVRDKAVTRVNAIMNDAKMLRGQQGILRQSVLRSVFASAYNVGGLKIEGWPQAPLALGEIYDQVILPPLRKKESFESMRNAWIKRILQEGTMVEQWGRGGKDQEESAEMERFVTETRPVLQWQMEVDLFETGDEKASSLRMLAHIEKYLGHKNEVRWIEHFEALVTGPSEVPGIVEDGTGPSPGDGG